METIQVVLDTALLRAADGAAKRPRINRSALIRDALRQHLADLRTRELEARDRDGYLRHPESSKAYGNGGIMAGRIMRGEIRLYGFRLPTNSDPSWSSPGKRDQLPLRHYVAPVTSTIRVYLQKSS